MGKSGTNSVINLPCFLRFFPVFLLLFASAPAQKTTGDYRLSPYFDSNVRESPDDPFSSGGLKIGAQLSHQRFHPRWNGNGNVQARVFLDGRIPQESKVALNVESGLQYTLSPLFYSVFHFGYFHKSFLWRSRDYRRSEAIAGLGVNPSPAVSAKASFQWRNTRFVPLETFRFTDRSLELSLDYAVSRQVSARAAGSMGRVHYRDFPAYFLSRDSLLVPLDDSQQDEFFRGLIHLRYRGRMVLGVQASVQTVSSNSVVGEFDMVIYRAYLSGRSGRFNFFHLVYQRVDKRYRYPGFRVESGYRDPEEKIQNQTHFRWERTVAPNAAVFLQISLLQNETIWNQLYYNKVLAELGIVSDF